MSVIKIDTGSLVKNQGLIYKKFEIYKLVKEGDPSLKQICVPFDFKKPQHDPVYLATSLFETMFQMKGLGLSACQVGLPYRVFVVGFEENNKQVFFNPEIVAKSEELELQTEGCLSYNGLYLN